MGEKFRPVPDEARDFKTDKEETPDPDDHTIQRIQEGPAITQPQPKAVGNLRNRLGPDGKLITTEMTEKYHGVDTTKEFGAGDGPNPSWSQDPNNTPTNDQTAADADDDD